MPTEPIELKPCPYVAGLMFSQDLSKVALIRKNKPAWQSGKLNGIGGKVEPGEEPLFAMVREFQEETGQSTSPNDWTRFLAIGEHGSWRVDWFFAVGDLSRLRSVESEPVEITGSRHFGDSDCIENLPWIVALAIDSLTDGRPAFTEAYYGTRAESVNAELLAACELAYEAMSDRYDGVEDSTNLWMGESMRAMENAITCAKGAK